MGSTDIFQRIDIGAIISNAKMQVGTGRAAGGTHIADDLTGLDILAGADDVMGHVHINRREMTSLLMISWIRISSSARNIQATTTAESL